MHNTQVPQTKVCHFTTVHPASDTRILFRECKSLSKKFDITLIAPYTGNYQYHQINTKSLPKTTSRILRFLYINILVSYKAITTNAEIYHFHDPELIPLGLLLKILGKKIIFDVHELTIKDIKNKNWLPFKNLASIFYLFFENLACKYFHFILAEKSYENYYKFRVKNYAVIQNFPEKGLLEKFKVLTRNNQNLFYIGNISGKRGIHTIIKAIYFLNKNGQKFILNCVGEYNNKVRLYLESIDEYHRVRDQLIFHNYMPIDKGLEISKKCFVGIALPEPIPNHINSYPTKIFEYMAIGLPVICSDFPINKEVIEKNNCGLCINPLEHTKLAEAILYIYKNNEIAMQMGGNGISTIESIYNWNTEEKKLFDFYSEVIYESNNN